MTHSAADLGLNLEEIPDGTIITGTVALDNNRTIAIAGDDE